MNPQVLPELISFKVCPFVQRSAIILNEKHVDYTTTYIDLKNRPDWFADVSPLGKVPVLRVGDTVVFESAVIAEYIDECFPPSLHPSDLLEKAKHRAWVEFASNITMNMFAMLKATNKDDFDCLKAKVAEQLQQVEQAIDADGPYFSGKDFALVDAAYAPVFSRLILVDNVHKLNLFTKRITHWAEHLLQRESVQQSVVEDFDALFMDYIKNSEGYLSQYMGNL
jgi:glutathione S-transferase